MFIVKVGAQTRFFWNGQNRNEKREMVLFEVTGLNIIQELCGMVSNLKTSWEIIFIFIHRLSFIFHQKLLLGMVIVF